jgi:hypothetical protein
MSLTSCSGRFVLVEASASPRSLPLLPDFAAFALQRCDPRRGAMPNFLELRQMRFRQMRFLAHQAVPAETPVKAHEGHDRKIVLRRRSAQTRRLSSVLGQSASSDPLGPREGPRCPVSGSVGNPGHCGDANGGRLEGGSAETPSRDREAGGLPAPVRLCRIWTPDAPAGLPPSAHPLEPASVEHIHARSVVRRLVPLWRHIDVDGHGTVFLQRLVPNSDHQAVFIAHSHPANVHAVRHVVGWVTERRRRGVCDRPRKSDKSAACH